MGSLFAAKLASQGATVHMYNRKNNHTDKINMEGLTVLVDGGVNQTVSMTVFHSPEMIDDYYDIVIVLVKAFATEKVLLSLLPHLNRNSIILSLQNGLGNAETIKKIAPKHIVSVGGTETGAGVIENGVIAQRAFGKTYIGETNTNNEKLTHFVQLLSASGLESYVVPDIQRVIWNKLMINIAYNGLTAITRLRNGDAVRSSQGKRIIEKVVREAAMVAQAEGISFHDEEILRKCIRIGYEDIGENKSSMLTDIIEKRKTEIDYINGAVVSLGKKHSISTPYNEMITDLIKMIEASYSISVSSSK